MPRVDEVFNTQELINYFKGYTPRVMIGESLFPKKKIQDIEFDMIVGKGGAPVSALVHAHDTKTKLASREAISKGVATLALIKRQFKITEKDIIKINNPRNNAELDHVLSELYNDASNLYQSILVRTEAMRMELLSSGVIKIEENGVKVTVDYKVPATNKKSYNWSNTTTSKPLDDLEELASAVETASGSRPTRMLTSRKIFNNLTKNESIRSAIHGVNASKIVTKTELNNLLTELDLPTVLTYEDKYKVEGPKGFTTTRYFPENKISMFGPDTLGHTIFGLTAEEVKLIGNGNMEMAQMINDVFVGTYTEEDPVAEFTKACATVLPTFPHADELGIGTITV